MSRLSAKRLRTRRESRLRPAAVAPAMPRPGVSDKWRPAALDLAAEVGSALLSNGAAASEIVDLVLDICMVAGLVDVSVVVTYDQVIVSLEAEETFRTIHSRVAPVRNRTVNFGTYTSTVELAQRYLTGEVSADQALEDLRGLGRAPRWPRWFTTLAAGVTGFSAGIIFGAAPFAALLAFVAVMFSDSMFRFLAQRRWPGFFIQMFVGAIAVLVASVGLIVNPGMNAYAVVVAVMIVALAGMTVTGAVQDAVTGWYLTGSVRVFEALVKTAGLLVGIRAMAALLDLVGAPSVSRLASAPTAIHPVTIAAATAMVVLAFAVMVQTPCRGIITGAIIGVAGHLTHTAALSGGVGAVWSAAMAALVIGVLGALVAPWVHIPFSALTSSAVLPLLPGLARWRTQDDRLYTPHFSEPVATLRERNALDRSPRVFSVRQPRGGRRRPSGGGRGGGGATTHR